MNIIQPAVKLVHATPESLITHAGRHSYQSHAKANEQSDAQLLRHFVKQNESPLEHSFAMLDVVCSYAAHVHFLRHRHGSFSFLSARYTQGLGVIVPDGLNREQTEDFLTAFFAQQSFYESLRAEGVQKQVARYVIPQASAVRGSISGNARFWLTMLELRTSKKAMPETRQVAQMIQAELKQVWPITFGGDL